MIEGDEVRQANNIIMGSHFLGQAVGSLIGFLLIGKVAMMSIIWIDAITFLISAILCFGLPNIKNQTEPSTNQSLWKEGYRIIKSNHRIFIAMFYLFLTVIIMQSFNQIARNWLPLVWLHLPNRVGALSEVIGCLGIVTGLMIVSVFLTKGKTKQSQLQISFFIAIFSMALPFLSINPIISLAFYFIYMVLFEVSLMVAMNQLLYHCNTQETPSIMVIFYGSAFGGMSIITLIIATATDKWGLPIVTAIMLLLAVLAVFAVGRVEFKTRIEGVRAEASLE
jgi:predicted MFS family arabinose efflux permease